MNDQLETYYPFRRRSGLPDGRSFSVLNACVAITKILIDTRRVGEYNPVGAGGVARVVSLGEDRIMRGRVWSVTGAVAPIAAVMALQNVVQVTAGTEVPVSGDVVPPSVLRTLNKEGCNALANKLCQGLNLGIVVLTPEDCDKLKLLRQQYGVFNQLCDRFTAAEAQQAATATTEAQQVAPTIDQLLDAWRS
jgi:hypothetical protein